MTHCELVIRFNIQKSIKSVHGSVHSDSFFCLFSEAYHAIYGFANNKASILLTKEYLVMFLSFFKRSSIFYKTFWF